MPIVFNGKAVNGVQFNADYLESAVNCNKVIFNGEVVFDNSGELTLASIPLGSKIQILENGTPYWWMLHDKNYNGYGVPVLVRNQLSFSCVYHFSIPSNASSNKYSNSALKSYANDQLDKLETGLSDKILTVNVPCRTSAQVSSEYFVEQKMFVPSAVELGLRTITDDPYEGRPFEYIGDTALGSNYYTRTPTGGMNNSVRAVKSDGTLTSVSTRTPAFLRPAFCLPGDTRVEKIDGGYSFIL